MDKDDEYHMSKEDWIGILIAIGWIAVIIGAVLCVNPELLNSNI